MKLREEIRLFYTSSECPPKHWKRAFDLEYVAFDGWGDWPRFYACWARERVRDSEGVLVWDLKAASLANEVIGESTLEAYCRMRWNLSEEDLAAEDDWKPVLLAEQPPPQRAVSHPKFGVGTVLAEPEPGKLKVDFGAAGVRVLAARFVTEVERLNLPKTP